MILHKSNREYSSQLATSALVRKHWVSFEQWLSSGPRVTTDKRRQELCSEIDDRCLRLPARQRPSKHERDAEKNGIKLMLEEQLVKLAKLEWEKRLKAADLRAEDWIDITVPEAMAVERAFGGELADLSEVEYAANWAAANAAITQPSANSNAAASSSQLQAPRPPAPAAPTSAASTTYQVVNPNFFGYVDGDDEERAEAASSLEALTMLATEYITSDEDADVDTLAYVAWGGNHHSSQLQQLCPPPPSTASSSAEQLGAQVLQSLNGSATSSKNQAKTVIRQIPPKPAITSKADPPPKSAATSSKAANARKAEEERRAAQATKRREEEELEKKRLQEPQRKAAESLRHHHSHTRSEDPLNPTSLDTSDLPAIEFPSDPYAIHTTSTSVTKRNRGPSYVGPHLHSDPTDTTLEEAEFERFKMSVRIEKIMEFHREAADLDINLARDIHNSRNIWGLTPEQEVAKIAEHEEKMLQLRRTKETERKEIVDGERLRRREMIRQRSASQDSLSSETSLSHSPPHPAPPQPFRTAASRRLSNARPPPPSTIPRQNSSESQSPLDSELERRFKESQRLAQPQPQKVSEPLLAPNLTKRFLDSQRSAAMQLPADASPIDSDLAKRFQESQRLAQAHQDVDSSAIDADLAKRFMESQRAAAQLGTPFISAKKSLSRDSSEATKTPTPPGMSAGDLKGKGRQVSLLSASLQRPTSRINSTLVGRGKQASKVELDYSQTDTDTPTTPKASSRFWAPSEDKSSPVWGQATSRATPSSFHPLLGADSTLTRKSASSLRHATVEDIDDDEDEESWMHAKATLLKAPENAAARPRADQSLSSILQLQAQSSDSPFFDSYDDESRTSTNAFQEEAGIESSLGIPGEWTDMTSPEYWEAVLSSDGSTPEPKSTSKQVRWQPTVIAGRISPSRNDHADAWTSTHTTSLNSRASSTLAPTPTLTKVPEKKVEPTSSPTVAPPARTPAAVSNNTNSAKKKVGNKKGRK